MHGHAVLAGLLCTNLTLSTVGLAAQDQPTPNDQGRAEEIRRLIGQLDSEHYREREQATRKLSAMEDALPTLRRVLQSPSSLELRRRVEQILAVFRERQRQRELAADMAKGKGVAVDVLVDRLVHRGKAASEADWRAVADLAWALTIRACQVSGKDPRRFVLIPEEVILQGPLLTVRTWSGDSNGRLRRIVASAISESNTPITNRLVVCHDRMVVGNTLTWSIVLANGDVRVRPVVSTQIYQSLIFCDGDVVATRVVNSLIVATGTVKLDEQRSEGNVILEKARNPLPFLKLFETAEVGVEVTASEGGVQVKQVRPGSAFATAGLRAGDRIVAVSGTAVKSAEQFRRLLRRKVAEEADALLTIRRGARDLQLRVALRE